MNYQSIFPAFISLGSNQKNPKKQLFTAIKSIKANKYITLLKQSSFFATKPYGYLNQPDFINAVIKIQTSLTCEKLLTFLKEIEQQQQRVKTIHWGPRTLDLDILCYADCIIDLPYLKVPHPDLKNRIFVLEPWVQIAPDWALPDGSVISDLYYKLISPINNINSNV
ncbi:MAG: 2-amino-4-hydroxy-6-hydroxymethyldihydropteridine diphosphokinase [Gammaproteobacteria bacterium]|nr:2-amino-4-hydroxy-6-hydroxymethyldihydropteridine diphosphokinase [Gammaproteobacteria bacterium]